MKRLILLWLAITLTIFCFPQKKWDGGGNNNQWNNDQNWFPDGIPAVSDEVILDNSLFPGSYLVELPSGNSLVEIRSLFITPDISTITLLLPLTNTATTALMVTGSADAIIIGKNGILRNASGAGSGTPILPTGLMKILNGGKYIHQTPRGNAALIDKLSISPGTEQGIFEFDVPGLSGYTVSLTSNTFGTLRFRAESAGGIKSYSGSGTGNLNIRGDLIIDAGVQLSSTLTADILLAGNLQINGRFNLIPVTAGSTGRSIRFLGKNALFSGGGLISMNANFRNLEITSGSYLSLARDCPLNNPSNAFINYGTLETRSFSVSGIGKFAQADLATLVIGSEAGIQVSGDSGNIQTGIREFSKKSAFLFNGGLTQRTGSALPDTVSMLGVNNPSGIILTRQIYCSDSLVLLLGNIYSDNARRLVFGGRIIQSGANEYGQVKAGWKNSFVSGPMVTDAADTGNYLIPIGSDTVFAPLIIRKTDPGKLLFETIYTPARPPDTLCNPSLVFVSRNEYWSVKTNGNNFSGGYLSFSIRPGSFQQYNGYTLKPAIYQLQGNERKWTAIPGKTELNNSFGWIKMDSLVSGFNDFTLGFALPEQPLAWRLINFSASSSGKSIRLRWQADEDNETLLYTLEKSRDGMHFYGFQSLTSSGKTFAHYDFEDRDPYPGNSFYRLGISTGNRKEYSPVTRVTVDIKKVMLFPNPASDLLHIYFPDLSSRYELAIVNVNGVVVYKTFVNTVNCQIRVSNLRNGFYFVRLRHNNGLITLPFTKY